MYKSYSELGAQPEQNIDAYAVPQVINAQHKQELIQQNRLVCVNIYADWCGPCKQTAPEFSIIAQNFTKPGLCVVVKENWDKKITQVGGIPTYQFFLDGQQVDQVIGADLAEVEKKLTKYIQGLTSGGGVYGSQEQNPRDSMGPTFNRNSIRNYRPGSTPSQNTDYHTGGQPYMQQNNYNQPYQYMQQ
jgi:thioredoxin 1